MKIKHSTDNELIALITDLEQTPEYLQAAWQEFIDRFEYIVIRTARIAFRHFAPQQEFTIEQICAVAERVFSYLVQDKLKPLRELEYQLESDIEIALQKLT
ncbi:MAG: hypothetical protein AB1489_22530, partial [Acidobacteriota bacterium]